MFGAVAGMYFQPTGLQFVMTALSLRPGEGAREPFAVPADRPLEANIVSPDDLTAAPMKSTSVTDSIIGLGRIIPNGDIRTVALPYGASDAKIETLLVEEGDKVERGAILANLDNEQSLNAAVSTARANLAASEAALEQARRNTVSNRDEAKFAKLRAEAALTEAKRSYDRAEKLRATNANSIADLDSSRSTYEQASRDVDKATVTLARYDFQDLDKQPDIVVASRNLDAANAELNGTLADLEKAFIRAPVSGTVLTIHTREGEKPDSDGVLNIGNLDVMTVEAEIYQTLIGAVEVGANARISADAVPKPLRGRVTRIGLEVQRQTVTDASPAANTDARVVKVYISLDPASAEIARHYISLQVTARIEKKGET